MKTTLHQAATRGHANHGWLDSHHTFSFANYYDPERVHFGTLRVLNDDIVAPGKGFGKHPHDNMEIISIPLKGSLMHEDSMGHRQVIGEDEVQVMSAGTGIFHSEYNASIDEAVNFLQLWILPEKKNIQPIYKQLKFDKADAHNQWQILVDEENGPLKLNQKASISRVFLDQGEQLKYKMKNTQRKSYVFVLAGSVQLENIQLSERDGLGIEDCKEFNMNALKDSYLINIEV
ncbi:MAG: pirin family protein [Prolixibacteraceae bacterium]